MSFKEFILEKLPYIIGIILFILIITFLELWAYNWDWRCLIADCRILK